MLRELSSMGLLEFEEANRRLAMRLFGDEELSAGDEEMLGYFVSSGTYGTAAQSVANRVAERGRLGYLVRQAFPPFEIMAYRYPILRRVPALLPACWVARISKALVKKPGKVLFQVRGALRGGRR